MKGLIYLSTVLTIASGYNLTHRPESAHNVTVPRDCGKPTNDFLRLSANIHKLDLSEFLREEAPPQKFPHLASTLQPRAKKASPKKIEPSIIKTYVHVVAKSKSPEDGYIPDSSIHAQLSLLNRSFSPHNFHFTLHSITHTISPSLSTINDTASMALLGTPLRRGTYADLNLYIVHEMSGHRAGDCSLPSSDVDGVEGDGCRIVARTVAGGVRDGGVTVHEVGHWLGLKHTFQGMGEGGRAVCGDESFGDFVGDMLMHLQAGGGFDWGECGGEVDSCPEEEGKDPIRNFMNYTPCWNEFTEGQGERMRRFWAVRRRVASGHKLDTRSWV